MHIYSLLQGYQMTITEGDDILVANQRRIPSASN